MKTLLFLIALSLPLLAQPQNLQNCEIKVVTTNKNVEIKLYQPNKVTILDFFITTCPHCQQHSPHMGELARKYPHGLSVISFAADGKANPTKLSAYIQQYKVTNPVIPMTNEHLGTFLPSNRSVPQMLVYDRKGQLIKVLLGWDENTKKNIETLLQTLLRK